MVDKNYLLNRQVSSKKNYLAAFKNRAVNSIFLMYLRYFLFAVGCFIFNMLVCNDAYGQIKFFVFLASSFDLFAVDFIFDGPPSLIAEIREVEHEIAIFNEIKTAISAATVAGELRELSQIKLEVRNKFSLFLKSLPYVSSVA